MNILSLITRAIGLACLTAIPLITLIPFSAQAAIPVINSNSGTGEQCFDLLAGQSINAGSVCVNTDGTNLNVTYATTGGWQLTETHLWIGNNFGDLPQTKTGNPVPGQFPHKSGNITGQIIYTVSIPLSSPIINFSCPSNDVTYYLAGHATVRKAKSDGTYQTETGWAAGSPITSKGSWATFSTFTLHCFDPIKPPVGETKCETAFARYSAANISFLDLSFQRWGWTNGPLAPASYTMDLYAGAAQSDISKGTWVGTLDVSYDGSNAHVTYNTENGWWMQETQLYVGNDRLPKFKQGRSLVETVAPGQYPSIHDVLDHVTTDSYMVSITGNIYVVAHAVTCHIE